MGDSGGYQRGQIKVEMRLLRLAAVQREAQVNTGVVRKSGKSFPNAKIKALNFPHLFSGNKLAGVPSPSSMLNVSAVVGTIEGGRRCNLGEKSNEEQTLGDRQ